MTHRVYMGVLRVKMEWEKYKPELVCLAIALVLYLVLYVWGLKVLVGN